MEIQLSNNRQLLRNSGTPILAHTLHRWAVSVLPFLYLGKMEVIRLDGAVLIPSFMCSQVSCPSVICHRISDFDGSVLDSSEAPVPGL